MSWLIQRAGAPSAFEAVLAQRPELLRLYRRFYGALWDHQLLPPRLLELCRLRIAQLHGCDAELCIRTAGSSVPDAEVDALRSWERHPGFDEAERAALRFAEKVPWDHHQITDADADAVREHLGEQGLVALAIAVALFDVNCRLRLVLGIEPASHKVPAPASADVLY